ncbi:MAG: methyltransferase [Simkaniaceae bacterium]|nr:methyltransferase [Simkaniaceae bacterium]
MQLNWKQYNVSQDETHHIFKGNPAYPHRFLRVLKFHPPGIAPVKDLSGAYHISPNGAPLYSKRYYKTFGFYCDLAAVVDEEGWFHIFHDGLPMYKERYAWCGNFQEGCCAVRDVNGNYFHINMRGKALYSQIYAYAGDFHDGVAVVQEINGLHYHVDPHGLKIHSQGFLDLDTFHKGYARAKDASGWFHIDRQGNPLYLTRYTMVEPFYNGYARVENEEGLRVIDEKGGVIQELYSKNKSSLNKGSFHKVSKDLVSYWKLYTLEAATKLQIFASLPGTLETLVAKTLLKPSMLEKILLALLEIDYVEKIQNQWKLSEKGMFLTSKHPLSLTHAQGLWMAEHLEAWKEVATSLQQEQSSFEHLYRQNWFDFIKNNPEKEAFYHQVLSHYASNDYQAFGEVIDCTKHQLVADIGGSTGTLIKMLLKKYPHIEGAILDRPSVLEKCELQPRLTTISLDFFKKWPKCSFDGIILSRVLHDWEDRKALHILKEVRKITQNNGRLYIIENLLDKDSGRGALLNLNMWVMTGGKERTLEEFENLCSQAKFSLHAVFPLNTPSSILVFDPL